MIPSVSELKQASSRYYPGIVVSFTVAAAATFLSEHYFAPVMLFALLLGIAFHFLMELPSCSPGIEFSARNLLKIGIALLGVRITFADIASLGWTPVAIVLGLIVITIASGILFSRVFGRRLRFGLLTGGAVAICGASAALAISSVLKKDERLERDTLFTVITVTMLSTIAMIAYPIFFRAAGYDDITAGALIGATIHDVAQVVGAGYSISPEAGDTATYIKLLRVSALPVVVILIALLSGSSSDSAKSSFPWFAIGFAVTLSLNSLGLIPEILRGLLDSVSGWLLVAAIAALGVRTSLKSMIELGPLHLVVIVAETVFLFTMAVMAWKFLV
jgi:uncharacterized integral membrane protein (TIGR00698 family)